MSRKLKRTILITAPYFFPKTGGLEHYALYTAQGLFNAGWRVIVACGDDVSEVTREDLQGITVYRLPIRKKFSNTPVNPAWAGQLRKIIRDEKPDIINAHTPVPFMVDMTALAAGKTPLVITNHAATLSKPAGPVLGTATAIYSLLQNLTFARANAIIAVSPYVRDTMPRFLQGKTHVITNAVHGTASARRTYGQGIVFIPTMLEPGHAWKGVREILTAWGHYRTRYGRPPLLTILGAGSMLREYKQLAADLRITRYVRFVGLKSPSERNQLLRQASALVSYPTTANDAFPTVFLEAWAQGATNLAAAIGPIPSLIADGETGLLVAPNEPVTLAERLRELELDPKLAKRLGEAGRQLVNEKYLWPTKIRQLVELLEDTL